MISPILKHIAHYTKSHFLILLIVVVGLFFYMAMIFPSGSNYCYQDKCGIFFWGIHSHDSIWHIALTETAFTKIPFIAPTFSGSLLSGYNYLYDLTLFLLSRFGFSTLLLFFKIIPFIWFITYVYLQIKLAKKINNSQLFVVLFLIFMLFTSSFSYYFTLVKDKTIIGSYAYLSQLPMHIMLNIQFAISLLGILVILIKMLDRKITNRDLFLFGFLIALNLGLKFYGGVVTFAVVFFYLFFSYYKSLKKLIFSQLVITSFFVISLFVFYNPLASIKSGSIFTFSPFSIVHPITEDPSLFYLRKLTDARYFLMANGIGIKLVLIELLNLALFLFFYLGVRTIGVFYLLYKLAKRKISVFDLTIFCTIVVATSLSVLLVQKAEWWNSIQFFYYAIFISTIYLIQLTYELIKKLKIVGRFIVILIFILAIPATLSIAEWSFYFPGNTYLPEDEVKALQVLKKEKYGIVYSPIFNNKINTQTPIPLYVSGDTAYVSAFSGKPSYIADILQLRLTGVDYKSRLKKVETNDCSILSEIDYIYYNNDNRIDNMLFNCPIKLKMIYGNRSASIYRVEK